MQAGIDNSLSLLKQLQSKLQSNSNYANSNNINSNYARLITKPHVHQPLRNFRTEPPSYTLNQHNQQSSYQQQAQGFSRSIPSTVPNKAQPLSKVTSNPKKCRTISPKPLAEENKRLKKYITCLIKMNQYLKNQIAQRSRVQNIVQRKYVDSQIDLLKMEIQYLKQLNSDKQIEIRKYRKKLRSTSRRSKRTSSSKSTHSNHNHSNHHSNHKCCCYPHSCNIKLKGKTNNTNKFKKTDVSKSPKQKNLKKKGITSKKFPQKKR